AGYERLERLRVIRGGDDYDAEFLLVRERAQRGLVGRAGGHDRGLAGEVTVGTDGRRLPHHQLGAGDKKDRRERNLLPALDIARGRAAFEIDLAGRHLLQAIGWGHRRKCDLDLHAVEFGGRVFHNLAAKVDRVPDRLLPAIEIGERQRAFAIAER